MRSQKRGTEKVNLAPSGKENNARITPRDDKIVLAKMLVLHNKEWYIRSRLEGDIIGPSVHDWAERHPTVARRINKAVPSGPFTEIAWINLIKAELDRAKAEGPAPRCLDRGVAMTAAAVPTEPREPPAHLVMNDDPGPDNLKELNRKCGAAFADPARFGEAIDLKQKIACMEAGTTPEQVREEKREQMRQEILAGHPANTGSGKAEQPDLAPVPDTAATPPNIWQFDPVYHRLILTESETGRQNRKSLQCREFSRSDLGNAQRFTLRFGRDARYCHTFNTWFVWDGRRWARDNSGLIYEIGKDVVLRLGDEAPLYEFDTERQAAFKWAAISQSKSAIENLVALSRSSLPVMPDEFDRDLVPA